MGRLKILLRFRCLGCGIGNHSYCFYCHNKMALREVEHDDDWFPVGDIQMICRIVDPYGTDEELQRYLEGEEECPGEQIRNSNSHT